MKTTVAVSVRAALRGRAVPGAVSAHPARFINRLHEPVTDCVCEDLRRAAELSDESPPAGR